MKMLVVFIGLVSLMTSNAYAAVWIKLHENNASKLMLDKQSILQKDQLKRVWVKIEYKKLQKNLESPEKEYNLSKLLWYFDCTAQKSATSQVFQYLNNELVYSAGIDAKSAEFNEPVPETEIDIAMRYVCLSDKATNPIAETKPATKGSISTNSPATAKTAAAKAAVPIAQTVTSAVLPVKPEPVSIKPVAKPKATETKPNLNKGQPHKTEEHASHWTYEGKEGPEHWGKLKPEFIACDIGSNQSPINIEKTMHTSLMPLMGRQDVPTKNIFNNGHTVQVNFKEGNTLVLDGVIFNMKQVHFHSPGENKIHDKSFPMEAHFVHADAKGNLAVIGVMFKEGAANAALEKLWSQMPKEISEPVALKSNVNASELLPENRSYYRFSGSLTTPPCSEGVRWLLMKSPITASKAQIKAFEQAVHHPNNRPIQPLNGRVVLE
ncbi:MAG: carbonic anhydrase family protein [Methylophilaceae bacterium]|nr:carbonic anhydrase family protein [Methylophilaceae bacterium]